MQRPQVFFFAALIFSSGLVLSHSSFALEKCQNKTVMKWSLSPIVIDSFLNPSKNSDQLMFPVPPEMCIDEQSHIVLLDHFGSRVGRFKVNKVWKGKFSANMAASYAPDSLPRAYRSALDKRRDGIYNTVDFLLRSTFSYSNFSENSEVKILAGQALLESDYYLNTQGMTSQSLPVGVEVVDYQGLLKVLKAKGAVVSPSRPSVLQNKDWWRIPTSQSGPSQDVDQKTSLLDFGTLVQSVRQDGARFTEEQKKTPAVFYAGNFVNAELLNLIDWLEGLGFTKIYWFKNFAEWSNPSLLEKSHSVLSLGQVTGEELLTAAKDRKTLIVDLRERSEYLRGHIPGAVSLPMITRSGHEMMHLGKVHPFYKEMAEGLPSLNHSRTFLQENIKEHMTGKSRVIIYLDQYEPILISTAVGIIERNLDRAGAPFNKAQVSPYLGGYQDWVSRTEWLGRNGQYSISKGSQKSSSAAR